MSLSSPCSLSPVSPPPHSSSPGTKDQSAKYLTTERGSARIRRLRDIASGETGREEDDEDVVTEDGVIYANPNSSRIGTPKPEQHFTSGVDRALGKEDQTPNHLHGPTPPSTAGGGYGHSREGGSRPGTYAEQRREPPALCVVVVCVWEGVRRRE